MEFSLGVSMTPTAVRVVLVEGATADGATIDHFDVAVGSDAAEQVVAAILGTQESVEEGGHRLASTGVAWTDHGLAAELRRSLRAHGRDDVVLVSELHAASALAQAIGRAVGYERTALMFIDGDTATLAVVRTVDGAVVRVHTRGRSAGTQVLGEMVGRLDALDEPPQALYLVGGGPESGRLRAVISEHTSLPVHAPDDADLALARGAALASASAPRWEAETVSLPPGSDALISDGQADTQAAVGLTERADAAYMAPLGYSAVLDDPDDLELESADADVLDEPAEPEDSEPKSFFLVGSALAALFVVGMAALVISLAVTVKPAVRQLPDPGAEPVTNSQAPAPDAAGLGSAPETIQAPVPVVQEAPRTVYVAPAPVRAPAAPAPVFVPAPEPVAPAPAPARDPEPAPEPAPPPPPAPSPAAPAPVAPAPVPVPVPVPVVVPVLPPFLPQLPTAPVRRPPLRTPSTVPSQVTQAPAAPLPTTQQSAPANTPAPSAPVATQATQAPSSSDSGSAESGSGATQPVPSTGKAQSPLWPWPFGR